MKVRMCANGRTQRSNVLKEESSRPTVTTESVLITIMIRAKQERYVMNVDILNALSQTKVIQGDERIIMKIRGALVDMLIDVEPEKYKNFEIGEGHNRVLHTRMPMDIFVLQ